MLNEEWRVPRKTSEIKLNRQFLQILKKNTDKLSWNEATLYFCGTQIQSLARHKCLSCKTEKCYLEDTIAVLSMISSDLNQNKTNKLKEKKTR